MKQSKTNNSADSETITCLVVDDEELARERLKSLLAENPEYISVAGEAANGKEAIKILNSTTIDLLLLDIEMPVVNGFDLLDMIPPDERPVVIFITAYDEYAIQAFEERAVDYLLKPIRRKRLQKALERARETLHNRGQTEKQQNIQQLVEDRRTNSLERLPVHHKQEILLVPLEEVSYIEADGNLLYAHLETGAYRTEFKLDELEERLARAGFLRIHRSTLVNQHHIVKVIPWFKSTMRVELEDGTQLDVARRRAGEVKERLGI